MPCRHRCRGCLVAWQLNGRRWRGGSSVMAGTLHRRPAGILMGLLFVFATQSNQQIPWFGKVTRRLKPSNSGCKWQKPAENIFTWRQWFFFQDISVSGHSCINFIWKILSNGCRHKNDPSISQFFFIDFLAGFYTLAQWWGWVACRSLADHCYVWKVEMGLICFGKLILDRCVCSMSTTKLSWH